MCEPKKGFELQIVKKLVTNCIDMQKSWLQIALICNKVGYKKKLVTTRV